ncbi:hypothetical protein L596_018845 [Steinernema carpocapsae]|uniref:Uncharacterized protein n=1 Tax=Steinernema carpocapsae TaxID=34508 RepID=A0A4U5N6E2_STECR|nr:hypothetical protein L596_018845 [Steinernema carpocapsae]
MNALLPPHVVPKVRFLRVRGYPPPIGLRLAVFELECGRKVLKYRLTVTGGRFDSRIVSLSVVGCFLRGRKNCMEGL